MIRPLSPQTLQRLRRPPGYQGAEQPRGYWVQIAERAAELEVGWGIPIERPRGQPTDVARGTLQYGIKRVQQRRGVTLSVWALKDGRMAIVRTA